MRVDAPEQPEEKPDAVPTAEMEIEVVDGSLEEQSPQELLRKLRAPHAEANSNGNDNSLSLYKREKSTFHMVWGLDV